MAASLPMMLGGGNIMSFIIAAFVLFTHAQAAPVPVLADLSLLKKAGIKAESADEPLNLGYAKITPQQEKRLSFLAHEEGKCGGYEVLPPVSASSAMLFESLRQLKQKNKDWEGAGLLKVTKQEKIVKAVAELSEANLKATVEWLSAFPSRNHRLADPNVHVRELEAKVREILSSYPGMWSVELLSHNRTPQKSLKVHLAGSTRASEIVVLGGHLDSVNQSWSGGDRAPGADDNASGSANLLEALRVLTTQGRPERSVEFFWYAGEEAGLLGSAEIAQAYKAKNADVVAVLQLDMTLFPGSGEFVIGNVADYTSAWLREYLVAMNDTYLGVKLIADECGYACSDHASWHRQGYPALMPFESNTSKMNKKIHTDRDLADSSVSFRHSLVFAKIALILAMDLGNSTLRQPY
jgi:leucyl aminopeptidase